MRRSPMPRKRVTKRRTTLPRCSNRQCHAIARIEGMCVAHAEQLADKLFSEWVRERDGHCTWHNVGFVAHGGPLQAAHGEPRGNHTTRYDPRNCHALCRDHHMLVDRGSKHALKAWWLRSCLGDERYDALMYEALVPVKRAKSIEDALAWLKPVAAADVIRELRETSK